MKYKIPALPTTSEEFEAMLPGLAETPEGAVSACIAALCLLGNDPKDGEKALLLMDAGISRSLIRLASQQLERAPYLMGSYFAGTGPDNGYDIPDTLELELTTNPYSGTADEGKRKFFVGCSGAASPRPVTVVQRPDGAWFPHEWSSLITGIVPPR